MMTQRLPVFRPALSLGAACLFTALAAPLRAQEAPVADPLARAVASPDVPAPDSALVRIEDHPEGHYLDIVVGPADLPSGGPHQRLPIQLVSLPIEGWLHGFDVEMIDGQGRQLPSTLLHHANLIETDARELFAPIPRRLLAAGRETHEKDVPELIGVPLHRGERLLVATMLANPTSSDYPVVYARIRLRYSRPEDHMLQPRDVYPFYLDVKYPLGKRDFDLPPGTSTQSWEGSPAVAGRILGIGGHLHDYADFLELQDVTTGDVIWKTDPTVRNGRVVGVPTGKLWMKGGVPIEPDHVYRISVQYTNPTGKTIRDGGMGAIGGVIWVAKNVRWPAVRPPQDSMFVQDLRNTLTAPRRMEEEMGEMHMGDGGPAAGHGRHAPGRGASPEPGHAADAG